MLLDTTKETMRFLTDLPAHDAGRADIRLVGSADEWEERLGKDRPGTVVTVGNFDGVHLGHQKILRDVVARAAATAGRGNTGEVGEAQKQLLPAVLTFYPHPARVLRPQQAPSLLETLPQRLAGFSALGISAASVLQFDAVLAQASAEDFVREYLVDTMRARAVLVGASFRFGHKQLGDVELLKELGRRWGFEVVIVTPVIDGGDVVFSTARRGAARREQAPLPKRGFYVTEPVLPGGTYRSVTNVGVRPTFDGTCLVIESHLFDFAEALTAGAMKVRFLQRLRDEQKFSGPEALRQQVLKDLERAKSIFAPS